MANPKINLGEYELVDNQDGTMDVVHPSTNERFTVDGNAIKDLKEQRVEDLFISQGNSQVTISVPSDYNSIQAAWDSIPMELRRQYVIEIDPSTYDDTQFEDLMLVGKNGRYPATSEGRAHVLITTTDGTTVDVGSIHINNCTGQANPYIQYLRVNNATPVSDENTAIFISGSGQPNIAEGVQCNTIGTGGGESFLTNQGNGSVKIGGASVVDIGTDNVDRFVRNKSGGTVYIRDSGVTGSVADTVYDPINGMIQSDPGAADPSGPTFASTNEANRNGFVYNADEQTMYPMAPGKPIDSGTISIGAGGTDFIGRHNLGEQVVVDWWIENDPGVNVDVEEFTRWIDAEGKQAIGVSETTGNAGVDIGWVSYRRTTDL